MRLGVQTTIVMMNEDVRNEEALIRPPDLQSLNEGEAPDVIRTVDYEPVVGL